MTATLVVVVIVGIFFIVGLIVGAIIVIALPILRGTRVSRIARHEPGRGRREQENDDRMSDARVGQDEARPDERPRWPGDADNGYGG
jgi:hypothetical protein